MLHLYPLYCRPESANTRKERSAKLLEGLNNESDIEESDPVLLEEEDAFKVCICKPPHKPLCMLHREGRGCPIPSIARHTKSYRSWLPQLWGWVPSVIPFSNPDLQPRLLRPGGGPPNRFPNWVTEAKNGYEPRGTMRRWLPTRSATPDHLWGHSRPQYEPPTIWALSGTKRLKSD